jgi:hypothetical protein
MLVIDLLQQMEDLNDEQPVRFFHRVALCAGNVFFEVVSLVKSAE